MRRRFVAPSKSAFTWTPQEIIGDVALWLDASDYETLTLDVNDRVLEWADKSLNGNDAISMGTSQPLYVPASENGLGSIFWDRLEEGTRFLEGGALGISGNDSRYYYNVHRTLYYAEHIFLHGLTKYRQNIFRSTGNTGFQRWVIGMGLTEIMTETTGGSNVYRLIGWHFKNDEFNGWEFGRDGTVYRSGADIMDTEDNGYHAGTATLNEIYKTSGHTAEIVIFNRDLTQDEFWLMNKYLGCKWNLPVNSNNPYLEMPCGL